MSSYEGATRRIEREDEPVCALIQDLLPFYLDGDVSASSRALIDRHLPGCPQCASFLAGGRSVRQHLRREQPYPAPGWHDPVAARRTIARGRRELLQVALAALAVLALLAAGGISFAARSESSPAMAPGPVVPPTVVPRGGLGGFSESVPAPTAPPAEPTPTPVPAQP